MGNNKLQVYQSFWQFSLEIYNQEDVKKKCLSLQDEYGFNVNLILAALWAAIWQQKLEEGNFNFFRNKLKHFDENIVIPLRKARRVAVDSAGFEYGKTSEGEKSLKEQILKVEIEAEKIYQQQLEYLILNSFKKMKDCIQSADDYKINLDSFRMIGKENLKQYEKVVNHPSSINILPQLDCLLNSVVI